MKKQITDFRVERNEALTQRLFLLQLATADGSPLAVVRPGQFAEVRVDGEPGVFLRRPISIHRSDRAAGRLWLLVQRAGRGTHRLGALREGETLNLVYPLGNGFTLPEPAATASRTGGRYLLVGGGVGIAPLLETGAALHAAGAEVTFLLGGRTAADVVEADDYRRYGRLLATTEDGSAVPGAACSRGFVTQHPDFAAGRYDAVRVCGPMPMMRAVAAAVRGWFGEAGVPARYCEVSLENKMACGLGVCLCCVEDTRDGHRCVCSDGPVFDINDLKW